MAEATLAELRAATYKKRDSWWTVLLADPLAVRLVRLALAQPWVTPNRVTGLAFLAGLGAAGCFLTASPLGLVAGAVTYHLAFVLDCVDGKLARWQGSGSVVGGWLDFTLDQIRAVVCVVALLGGQYQVTGQARYLLLATAVVFLAMFRYLNGFLIDRALLDLHEQRSPTGGLGHRRLTIGDEDPVDLSEPGQLRHDGPRHDPPEPGLLRRANGLRAWLIARRIRLNIFSGIELQMMVLVVGPLVGGLIAWLSPTSATILAVTLSACVVMVLFELAQTARFLLAADRLRPGVAATTRSSR